jgi:hypothetical protein
MMYYAVLCKNGDKTDGVLYSDKKKAEASCEAADKQAFCKDCSPHRIIELVEASMPLQEQLVAAKVHLDGMEKQLAGMRAALTAMTEDRSKWKKYGESMDRLREASDAACLEAQQKLANLEALLKERGFERDER